MDYFSLGSEISYPDYNALVYLLRKFKRLTSDLKLGNSRIESDYGVYSVSGGLTSVGGNFILEDDVTISSDDVLLNCFYTFFFTVVDVNLSGTVNRRVISVTGDTGDNGELEVVLEPSLLESDEVILPDFKVDIVFDPHEYYTPVSVLDITLEVDKRYVTSGETATVTATVLDDTGTPVEDLELQFNFNGDIVTDVTDSSGVASADYTGVGVGWVTVTVSDESLMFYDGGVVVAEFTGNSITLGKNTLQSWLGTVGDVVIDWGDGSTSTVNNPNRHLTHNYNDGLSSHEIMFFGEVTNLGESCFYYCTGLTSVTIPDSVVSLGRDCFRECADLTSVTIPNSVTSLGQSCFIYCTGLTSITIPDSVTSLGVSCFAECTGLTSVTIPNSVTNIGDYCFYNCSSLIDYQLYWQTPPKNWRNSDMINNPNTVFTIPYGETSNYTAKNYPSSKLVERSAPVHTYSLSIASDKSSILTTGSVTISGTLLMDSTAYSGQSVALYDGSALIDTLTTDSNGEYSKTLTGLTAGTHSFKAVNTNAESSTITVTVTEPTPVHNYTLSVTGTAIIQTGDNDNITAILKDNGVAVSGETLSYEIKHGSTVIDSGSDTTDSNGEISISYTGTGVGDVSVIVSYGSLLQETFVIQDCHFYGDMTDVANKFLSTNYVSGRTIYYQDTTYTTDVEIEFKFKNNVPSNFLFGFGETQQSSNPWAKMMYYNDNDSLRLFVDNGSVSISNPSKTTDTIFKLQSSNINTITAYMDNVSKATRNTSSSHPLRCRIDSYTSTPVELEYLKIKAL